MKKITLAIAGVALAVLATQQSAQATLTTEASGTANLTGPAPSPVYVNYDVILDSSDSTYTYLYSFTAFPGDPISLFTVNASYVLSVLGYGSSLSSYGLPQGFGVTVTGSDQGPFGPLITPTTVSWQFYTPIEPILETVAFTSLFGPINGTGSLIDGGSGPWGDNPGAPEGSSPIPVPSPASVPEASTVMAGALMLLPFGIGAIRSLRRERTV
jgi:hypothetical protein